jgi:hypothetical protein
MSNEHEQKIEVACLSTISACTDAVTIFECAYLLLQMRTCTNINLHKHHATVDYRTGPLSSYFSLPFDARQSSLLNLIHRAYTGAVAALFSRIRGPYHSTKAIAGKVAKQIALATTNAQPVPIALLRGLLLSIYFRQCQEDQITKGPYMSLHKSDSSSSDQTSSQIELRRATRRV